MHFLTDPFHYVFIQRAVAAAIIVGILCACLGTFVVLRRMSLVGHALSHSALPGLVIAYLLGGPIFIGALIATVLTALGIGFLSKDEAVYEDTSVGMIPNIMFAVGILLVSSTKSYRDLSAMLFGNILGVTNGDLFLICLIAGATLLMVGLFYKELKLLCVDPNYAKAIGLPLNMLRYGFLLFLALTVVVGIQAVGTILTNALLVIPVAAARLLTDRLGMMMLIACAFAVIAALAGVYASYYFGLSSGASIVLMCALLFGIAWLIRRTRKS
jgi:manganese/iron transport system permease protein